MCRIGPVILDGRRTDCDQWRSECESLHPQILHSPREAWLAPKTWDVRADNGAYQDEVSTLQRSFASAGFAGLSPFRPRAIASAIWNLALLSVYVLGEMNPL